MGVGLRPSFHMYPDAHAVLDIKDGEATHPLELRLRRGVTVAGRVVAPDGKPVAEAFAFGRSYVPYGERRLPLAVGSTATPPQIEVKDGRFEIPGCDPEKPVTFYFLDVEGPARGHRGDLGRVGGERADHGAAPAHGVGPHPPEGPRRQGARLLRGPQPARRPEAGHHPRPRLRGDQQEHRSVIPGDFAYQINLDFDPDNLPQPGPDGRMTLRNLIPGAPYRFRGRDFTPEPGQTIDLGDVVVAKPPS